MLTALYFGTKRNAVTGGALSILSGVITLVIVAVFWVFVGPLSTFSGMLFAVSLSGILAIVGGIFAVKRKEWLLSLIGAIASIISIAGLLGIWATILILTSKKEFSKSATSRPVIGS